MECNNNTCSDQGGEHYQPNYQQPQPTTEEIEGMNTTNRSTVTNVTHGNNTNNTQIYPLNQQQQQYNNMISSTQHRQSHQAQHESNDNRMIPSSQKSYNSGRSDRSITTHQIESQHNSHSNSNNNVKREGYPNVNHGVVYDQSKYQRYYNDHHTTKIESSNAPAMNQQQQQYNNMYRGHYPEQQGVPPSHYSSHGPPHYPHGHDHRCHPGHNMHHRPNSEHQGKEQWGNYYSYHGHGHGSRAPSHSRPHEHNSPLNMAAHYHYGQQQQQQQHTHPPQAEMNHRLPAGVAPPPPRHYNGGNEVNSNTAPQSHALAVSVPDDRRGQFHPEPPPRSTQMHPSTYQAPQHYPRHQWAPREAVVKGRVLESQQHHRPEAVPQACPLTSDETLGPTTMNKDGIICNDGSSSEIDSSSKENTPVNNNNSTNNFGGCTCKKSKCLKLYCQCFASSRLCSTDQLSSCRCINCHNTPEHDAERQHARRVILERNPSAFQTKFRECTTATEIKILHTSNSKENNYSNLNQHREHVVQGQQGLQDSSNSNNPSAKYGHVVSQSAMLPVNGSTAAAAVNAPSQYYYKEEARPTHVALPPLPPHFERGSSQAMQLHRQNPADVILTADESNNNGVPTEHVRAREDGYWSSPTTTASTSQVIRASNDNSNNSSPRKTIMAPSNNCAVPLKTTSVLLAHKLGCKCRKSFCLKKYCECYHGGVKCGDTCRCINCKNRPNIPSQVVLHDNNYHSMQQQQPPDMLEAQSSNNNQMNSSSSNVDTSIRETSEGSDDNKATLMAALAMTSLFSAKVTSSPCHIDRAQQSLSSVPPQQLQHHYQQQQDTINGVEQHHEPKQQRSSCDSPTSYVSRQVSSSLEPNNNTYYENISRTTLNDDNNKRKSSPPPQQQQQLISTSLINVISSDDDHHSCISSHTMQGNSTTDQQFRDNYTPNEQHQLSKRPRLCTASSDDSNASSMYRNNNNHCNNSIPMLCSSGSVSPTLGVHPQQYNNNNTQSYVLSSSSSNSCAPIVSKTCFVCGCCVNDKLYTVPRPYMNNSHNNNDANPNRSIQCCFNCKEHLDYVSHHHDKKCIDGTNANGINLLPKSLSYRKICSKCGKTRGEHGELGFGNKCVFQDCGRCGAGVQMHVKANVPMGFLCTLTVKEGATPAAAESYLAKINDLAVAAALKKKLKNETSTQQVSV